MPCVRLQKNGFHINHFVTMDLLGGYDSDSGSENDSASPPVTSLQGSVKVSRHQGTAFIQTIVRTADDTSAGVKTVNGRMEPDNSSVSYQIARGAMVPVVWHLGPAFCAYCDNFKSVSLQSLHKHMNSKHKKESKGHALKVLRKTVNEPVDTKEGLSAIIIHEKKYCASCNDDEAKPAAEDTKLPEPDSTSFTYRIENGAIVPIVWHLGPAFCAYCEDFKSLSFQALHKHMVQKHKKENDIHEWKVLRKTCAEPVDEEGVVGVINHRKVDIVRGENGITVGSQIQEVHVEGRKYKRKHEDVI